jgi:hypothetical protein
LGKTQADDEPLSLITILDSNGLDDAQWCLRAVEGYDREIRLYAVWCARQVQHLMKDQRSIDALDVAERFANGLATENKLAAARDAASDVARDAARGAARDAAWAVAKVAAWSARASRDVAWAAVGDAAGEARAAWAARESGDVAGAAEDAQEVKFREMFCDILENKELKEKNTCTQNT